MATFRYTAVSLSGVSVEGVVEAYDRYHAVEKIKQDCPVVTSVTPVKSSILKYNITLGKITDKTLSLVCNQFAIILSAGLPLMRTVELVASQCDNSEMQKVLRKVQKDVEAGYSLAASFEKRDRGLPTTFIETIRAGEESGNLELAFRRLSTYFAQQTKTKQKAASALIYPAFVISVSIIVIIIIMTYAMPVFVQMFDKTSTELPMLTKGMIAVSNFFSQYILLVFAGIVVLVVGLKIFSKTDQGKRAFATLALHIPVVGKINVMTGAAQFAATMSTMLAAGLPILSLLDITGRSMSNRVIGKEIRGTVSKVESGRRLGECLAKTKYLPNLLVEMTAMGEETGSLESTLNVVGEYYNNEVDVATTRALALLEPIIIVVLAIFVVLLLFAVYEPLFNMYNGIY